MTDIVSSPPTRLRDDANDVGHVDHTEVTSEVDEPNPHAQGKADKPASSRMLDGLLVASIAVLLVICAYAGGREGSDWTGALYWVGQVLVFTYIAYRLFGKNTPTRERLFLVLLYAAVQSILRWAYSPHEFTFSDELQHLRSLGSVLTTQHLFSPNYNLPISPRYPGLQNLTAELIQVSSLPPFSAGVLVASVSHVLLAACVLLLFHELSRSWYVSCIGGLVYMLNPHAVYFNTSWLYGTLALPFTVLSIYFAARYATRHGNRIVNLSAVAACQAVVVMTHHVSAFTTPVLLVLIAVSCLVFRRSRGMVVPFVICTAVTSVVLALWITFVAPITVEYLGGPIDLFMESLSKLTQFGGSLDLPAPPTPLFDRVLAPVGVLLTLGLVIAGIRMMRERSPLERSFAWIGLALYVIALGLRATVSNGAELASRLLTYAMLFTSLAVATALWRLATGDEARRLLRVTITPAMKATAIAIVLLLGSIATSFPSWFQRIPGQFRIEAFPAGVDSVGLARAEWANQYLRPGSRYFGDNVSLTLLSTVGPLDPVDGPEMIYYADEFTEEHAEQIRAESAVYLDVDLRMASEVPMGGKYFPQDVMSGKNREPIEMDKLTKFDDIRGISRIYDSGIARLYDLRGGWESPYAR